MAQLRVTLALVAAVAGCRASEAGPSSGLTPPAGWRPLASLATAAGGAAKQAGMTVDGAEAWGEPARGCYGAWLGLHGAKGAPLAVADAILATLPAELPGVAVADVVKPAANADAGVLALAFTRGTYRGRVRAQLASSGLMAVVACFWNPREPAACETKCTQLLGSVK